MSTSFKNMTPEAKRAYIQKDITDALDESLENTRKAALNQMTLISQIMQDVELESGKVLHPYTDLPVAGQTSFVIQGLSITKTQTVAVVDLADETIEDMNPMVGTRDCLTTLLGQVLAKDMEKNFVDAVRADATIPVAPGGAATWAGLKAIIADMGPNVFNTVGPIIFAVSLTDYLDLISTDALSDAKDFLDKKIRIVTSEHLAAGEVLAYHTHGVAGGFTPLTIGFEREGGKQNTALIGGYSYGYAWDTKYIRFVTA